MSEGFILDTPEQITAFALLQVKYKLKLEVEGPPEMKWREPPAKVARMLLERAGRPKPGRTKKQVYEAYCAWLGEMGL